MELWAQEYDLKLNTIKAEYTIFNGTSTTSTIQLVGETITSTPSSTYLGLSKKNDKYKVYFEKRLDLDAVNACLHFLINSSFHIRHN